MTLNQRKSGTSSEKNDFSKPESMFDDTGVQVKAKPTRPFWRRKWPAEDLQKMSVVCFFHLLCLFAPFYVTPGAIWVGSLLGIITGMFGITLSYHRNLTHGSFMLPKWLEYTFAYCGVLALQGSPIDWVTTHRCHHRLVDSDRDPHSPNEGFWFSPMLWVFDKDYMRQKCRKPNNASDLRKQPFYMFIQNTYPIHSLGLGPLLYAIGGFPWVVWGMGMRIVASLHITWLVNSACHVWGNQTWKTDDMSKNNWLVGILAFGEGWHNNHHAFESSARHGLEWWQIDATWGVIKLLETLGLATNVKLPTESQKTRMAFPTSTEETY